MDEKKKIQSNEGSPQSQPKQLRRTRRRLLLVAAVLLSTTGLAVFGLLLAWPRISDRAAQELRQRWGLEIAAEDYSIEFFPAFVAKVSNVRLGKFEVNNALGQGGEQVLDPASPQLALQLGQFQISIDWKELQNTKLVVDQLNVSDLRLETWVESGAAGSLPAQDAELDQEQNSRTWKQQLDEVQKMFSQLRGHMQLKNLSLKNLGFVKRNKNGDLITSFDFDGDLQLKFDLSAALPNGAPKLSNGFGYFEEAKEVRDYQIESSLSINPGSAIHFISRSEPSSEVGQNLELRSMLSAFFALKLEWPEDFTKPIRLGFEPVTLELKNLAASLDATHAKEVTPGKPSTNAFEMGGLAFELRSPKPDQAAGCEYFVKRGSVQPAVQAEACLFRLELSGLGMNEAAWKSVAAGQDSGPQDPALLGAKVSAELGQSLELTEESLKAFLEEPLPSVSCHLELTNKNTKLVDLDAKASEHRGTLKADLMYFFEIAKLVEFADRAGVLKGEVKQQSAAFKNSLRTAQLKGQISLELLKAALLDLIKQRNTAANGTMPPAAAPHSEGSLVQYVFGAHPKVDAWSVLSLDSGNSAADLNFKNKTNLKGEGVAVSLLAGMSHDSLESNLSARVRLRSLKKKVPWSADELFVSHRIRAVLSEHGRAPQQAVEEQHTPKLALEILRRAQNSVLALWLRRPLAEMQSAFEFRATGISLPPELLYEYNIGPVENLSAVANLSLDRQSDFQLDLAKVFVASRVGNGVVPLVDASLNGRMAGKLDEGFLAGRLKLNLAQKVIIAQKDHLLQIQGKLDFPFKVVYSSTEPNLLVNARAQLAGLTFAKVNKQSGAKDVSVEDLTGQFPLEQQLALQPLQGDALPFQINWQPVLDENPFRRADSQRLAGLYSAGKNMTLRSVTFGQWRVGPLAAALAVKQNQLLVDSLDAEILGGVMTGQASVSIQPSRPTMSFSGRISQVDGAQLLGIPGLSAQDSALNARTAFVYNFKEALVEGRADVDRIPKPLLERTLARLDPSGSDAKISVARKALKLAAPGKMGVQMHDGLADLSLELVSFGSTQTLRIPALPLTRLLESKTAAFRQGLETAVPERPDSASQNP